MSFRRPVETAPTPRQGSESRLYEILQVSRGGGDDDGASTGEYVRGDKVYVVEEERVWTKRLGTVVSPFQEHPASPLGWLDDDPGGFCVVRFDDERQDHRLGFDMMFRAKEDERAGYVGPVFGKGMSSVNPHATRSWAVGERFFALEKEKKSLPLKKLGTVSRVSRWNDDPDKRKYRVEFEDRAMNDYAPYWRGENDLVYADLTDENDQVVAPQEYDERAW